LLYHLERVGRASLVDDVVVATTQNSADDQIVGLCSREGIKCFRGSEDDVLSRYADAAEASQADVVVRTTADCPLIDPVILDRTVQAFLDRMPNIDYVSNRLPPTFPRGLDTEIVSRDALETAANEAEIADDREHVTLFIWRQPERFRLFNVSSGVNLSEHRWTVDYPEDLELIRRLIEAVVPRNPSFTMDDCLKVLRDYPEWCQLNKNIEQIVPDVVKEIYQSKT
jgi:spore coat polysaccharide biosynthesis protein SpsF